MIPLTGYRKRFDHWDRKQGYVMNLRTSLARQNAIQNRPDTRSNWSTGLCLWAWNSTEYKEFRVVGIWCYAVDLPWNRPPKPKKRRNR